MSLPSLRTTVDTISREAKVLQIKKEVLMEKRKKVEEKMINSEAEVEMLEKVSLLLNKLSEEQRLKACARLEELCTHALQYAISSDYKAKIVPSTSRGKQVVDILIENSKTGTITSPLTENGGGIVDIVSVALRVVAMQACDPPVDGPIIMDEPYKMVSEEFIPMIAEFTRKISEDFGRQIIFCTHNNFLAQTAKNQILVSMGEDGSIVKGD